MYKVIYVDNHSLSSLESILNEGYVEGYQWKDMFQWTGRTVIVMEKVSNDKEATIYHKPGRPKKEVISEGKLGE